MKKVVSLFSVLVLAVGLMGFGAGCADCDICNVCKKPACKADAKSCKKCGPNACKCPKADKTCPK